MTSAPNAGQSGPGSATVASLRQGRYPISSSVVSGIAILLDSLVILGSGIGLYFLMVNFGPASLGYYTAGICSIWITTIVLFHFSELYSFETIVQPFSGLDRLLIAFGTGFLFLLAAAFAFKVTSTFSRVWFGAFAGTAVLSTLVVRLIFSRSVLLMARHGLFTRNMVIVGDEVNVRRLLEHIQGRIPTVMAVTGIFIDRPTEASIGGVVVNGAVADLTKYVRATRVDDVVIAAPWSEEGRILGLVQELRELPVDVYLATDLIGLQLDFRAPPGHFGTLPVFGVIGRPMSGWAVAIKAIEDYVLGLIILAIAAIPMLVIALAIRLDSPGPILFRQKRLGFNNREFWIYKFRTMRHEDSEGPTIQATRADTRITTVGAFLRKTSLDELPQLFNVLGGAMSLVGPRPHAVDHNIEYSREIRGYFARHRVKPGMTGWAQVNGLRGETDVPEKMVARVRHDIFYAEHWSLFFDLRILAMTAIVVATGRNAY